MSLIRDGSSAFAIAGPSREPDTTCEILTGWPAVSSIRVAWEALLADYSHPVPGLTWAALDAVGDALDAEVTPVVVCSPGTRRPQVLLALQVRRFGPFRLVEPLGRGLLPRHEPLVSIGGLAVPPDALLRQVARRLGRSVLFDLPRLRPSARGTRWLIDGLGRAPGWFASDGPGECQLRLDGGWPRVEASLGISLRRAAADGRQRASREGVTLAVRISKDCPAELLERLIGLALSGDDAHAAARRRVLRKLVARSAESGRLRCCVVEIDGRLAGGTIAWVGARQAVELVAAEDPAAARHAPQAVADLALIEHLTRHERLDGLLLSRHRRPAEILPPEPRPRLIGAPAPGLARVAASALHRALEGEDALLEGIVGFAARLLAVRRSRRRAPRTAGPAPAGAVVPAVPHGSMDGVAPTGRAAPADDSGTAQSAELVGTTR